MAAGVLWRPYAGVGCGAMPAGICPHVRLRTGMWPAFLQIEKRSFVYFRAAVMRMDLLRDMLRNDRGPPTQSRADGREFPALNTVSRHRRGASGACPDGQSSLASKVAASIRSWRTSGRSIRSSVHIRTRKAISFCHVFSSTLDFMNRSAMTPPLVD